MTIRFKNESFVSVDVYIEKSYFTLESDKIYEYTCATNNASIEIKLSISDKKSTESGDKVNIINISTVILMELNGHTIPSLSIKSKTSKFQNYTIYQYLTVDVSDSHINDICHIVDNYESVKKNIPEQKKGHVLHILKKSIIDTILEGLLLGALLFLVFSWKVAVVALLIVFIIATIVNFIMLKLSRSRHRILNWNRDTELQDDIDYFVQNIEKFCN